MADTSPNTTVRTVRPTPVGERIAFTIRRLQRLSVTAATPAARNAAAEGSRVLEQFEGDPEAAQRTMQPGFVRATTIGDLWFAAHLARLFGLALRIDGWQQRGGVDWGGTPELMKCAGDFGREYLPGFQKTLSDAARTYLDSVLPLEESAPN